MSFYTPLTYYLNKVAHSCKTYYYISYKEPKVNGTSGIPASQVPISMLLLLPTAVYYKVQHRVTNGTTFITKFCTNHKIQFRKFKQTGIHACTQQHGNFISLSFFQFLVNKFE